jgi:hypothetical protein
VLVGNEPGMGKDIVTASPGVVFVVPSISYVRVEAKVSKGTRVQQIRTNDTMGSEWQ